MKKVISDIIKTIIIATITCILLLTCSSLMAKADEFLELEEVSIDFRNYFPGGRSPLVTEPIEHGFELGQGLDLNVNSSILGFIYWNNKVNSMTDRANDGSPGQFRLVGWQFELGLRLSKYINLGYYHHSQHRLDGEYTWGGFPVEDGIQIKIFLYSKDKKDTIF